MDHENHVAVACADCRFFLLAYPQEQDSVRLRGWGFCARAGAAEPPPADVIAVLRTAVLGEDRRALRNNRVGLYRSEPEDGCEYFEDAVTARGALVAER